MSRNQRDRDQFIAECTRAGIGVHLARLLLRKAATAQRLAEAQCNGDWPYNGDRDRPSMTFAPCVGCAQTGCRTCSGTGIGCEGCARTGCITCQGAGKVQTNGRERMRHDARYGICPYCEASGVAKSQLLRGKALASGDRGCWTKPGPGDRACPDCRNTGAIVHALAEVDGYFARVGGDPRGWVVRLFTKDTPEAEIENGRARGIGVPA